MVNQVTRDRLDALGRVYRRVAHDVPGAIKDMALTELAESVHQSNAIEYSSLTLMETESILLDGGVVRDVPVREILESLNLARVMTEILVEDGAGVVTSDSILGWHRTLLSGIRDDCAGRYRRAGEWVRVGGHLGANPEFVPGLMGDLLRWYDHSEQVWFLDRIAKFHLEFEVIHPFVDGNGRLGRVLINQQLQSLGWPPLMIRDKGKHENYYPLFSGYIVSDNSDAMTRLLASLLMESLHRRLTLLSGLRPIPLARWARDVDLVANSAANKAKRQTIPAFRLRGHWMIDGRFTGDTDSWLEGVAASWGC